jgi:hypothetical protein
VTTLSEAPSKNLHIAYIHVHPVHIYEHPGRGRGERLGNKVLFLSPFVFIYLYVYIYIYVCIPRQGEGRGELFERKVLFGANITG